MPVPRQSSTTHPSSDPEKNTQIQWILGAKFAVTECLCMGGERDKGIDISTKGVSLPKGAIIKGGNDGLLNGEQIGIRLVVVEGSVGRSVCSTQGT